MADQPVTREKLINADKDVQVIEDFIKKSKDETVTTRFGDEIMTLKGLEEEVKKSGGYFKRYTTLAAANADIANIPVNSVVKVTSEADGGDYEKLSAGATSLTKSAYDQLTQAKNYADFIQPKGTPITVQGTDVLSLPFGTYTWAGLELGNTLVNMPANAPYKFGRLEIKRIGTAENATYKKVIFHPYGRDKNFYINTSYEADIWSGWQAYSSLSELQQTFTSKTELSNSLSSAFNSLTEVDYYGKKYTESELTGIKLYTLANYVGFNSISGASNIVFNAVKARIFNSHGGEIQYRVYAGSAVKLGTFGYGVTAANQNNYIASGICKNFPTSDTTTAQNIELDRVISILPNTPFVIVFRQTGLNPFSVAQHSAVSGNLENRGFNLIASAVDWGVSELVNGSVPAYTQAGFQLLLNHASSGSSAPSAYTPSLVLPPKIYALEGLEAHIYPEHLLVEDYKLYEHDITCGKGSHRVRGYVWNPTSSDAAGNSALTWTIHDKQKGGQLASASSTVTLANKNANSGVTKKVCVIGDSLVNSGLITQRLLDIAANDVMKVQLIGTRGTGLNKHEGRGGWKISDYATAGRNDYKFTVSGITTIPAINSTTYSFDGRVYMVQEVLISGGSGYIIANLYSGSAPAALGVSGTLTKVNSGLGDAVIPFSNIEAVPANPFWNPGAAQLDFARYLSVNSLATPDYVFIQLGVNDVFSLSSDQAVIDFTPSAFIQLDALISSIKSAVPSVKIAVVGSPVGANQDAFGTNYACGQTAWRYHRNLVVFNKQLYAKYSGKEAQSIYVLGSGVNVDTENNFPTAMQQINAHNSTNIPVQNNGVHPDLPGYYQIGDAWFPFMKAI